MTKLLLDSIVINRFRAFKLLQIDPLSRVNLIVGKNNVGKSAFLEALWMYAKRARPLVIRELLRSRDELPVPPANPDEAIIGSKERIWDIKHLFYGHPDVRDGRQVINIGPVGLAQEALAVSVRWYISETDEQGIEQRRLVDDPEKQPDAEPYVVARIRNEVRPFSLVSLLGRRGLGARILEPTDIPSQFIRCNGLTAREIAQLWDNIALTDWEQTVVEALHIISPEVSRISLLGNQDRDYSRIPVVRVRGLSEPIPLRTMGEGMNRLLGVILALVSAKDGLLLIDEIDNGLHYSVQQEIWRTILNVSRQINVQVFATTHSWDCIEAFQRAADDDNDGLLIRLENKDQETVATSFSQRELGIVTKEQIEVR